MRFKYYLRGIGLGILFATIVMTVSYEIHKGEIKISDAKVIERAEELGMSFPDTDNSDLGSTVIGDSTEAGSQVDDADSEDTGADTPNDGNDSGSDEAGATDDPVVSDDDTPTDATVEVTRGTTWRDIADELKEQGIITDSEEFWNYVYHNANGKPLHTGTFTIPAGSDYDSIIAIFTE